LKAFEDFAGNKRANNQQEEKQEESWQLPNIIRNSKNVF